MSCPEFATAPPSVSLAYTLFLNRFGDKKIELREPWLELCEHLKAPVLRQTKDALPLLKLSTFGHKRTTRGCLRHDENVELVYGLEGDYDAGIVSPEQATELLHRGHIEAAVCTTPSHSEDRPRWRVLAPLSRPVGPADRKALVAKLNGVMGGVLAPESFSLSQAFYVGAVEDLPYKCYAVAGKPIDIIQGLAEVYPIELARQSANTSRTVLRSRRAAPLTRDSLRKVCFALSRIPADDRRIWLKVGMALHSTGWECAFELWTAWSETSEKFDPAEQERTWASFRTDPEGGVTLGSLFFLARIFSINAGGHGRFD